MKRLLTIMTVIVLLFAPQFALASDLDDLKAADDIAEKLYYSLDSKDAEAYLNCFQDKIYYFDTSIGMPMMMDKEQLRQSKLRRIANNESTQWIEGGSIHSVVGTTGTIFKYGTDIAKPKGSPEIVSNIRVSLTYVKVNGKWLILSTHMSKFP